MNYSEEAERIVYKCTGEPAMLPDAPYQKRLIEMITVALEAAGDDARHRAGRCIVQVADGLLHDPKSDGVDGHVSAVLREIGTKLTELTSRQLQDEAMAAMIEEIRTKDMGCGR